MSLAAAHNYFRGKVADQDFFVTPIVNGLPPHHLVHQGLGDLQRCFPYVLGFFCGHSRYTHRHDLLSFR